MILASPGTDVTYHATGIVHAGSPRLLLLESYAGTGAFDQPMMATGLSGTLVTDGAWRDPVPLGLQAAFGVAAAARGGEVFVASAAGVWHASTLVTPVEVGAHVIALRYENSALPRSDAGERLLATLALPDGGDGIEGDAVASALAPGAEIDFRAGYVTDGGMEAPAGRTLWVTSVRRERGLVHVEAEGTLGVLARWRASRLIAWAEGDRTILEIAHDIARLAGYRASTLSASATSSAQTPPFTVRAGEPAATALRRLFQRTPDLVFGRGSQVMVAGADPEDEPVATFALAPYGDEHAILAAALTEQREAVGWARVLGDGAAAQAVDLDALDRGGGIAVAVDETLDAAGEVADRAATEVRRAALALERAWAEVVPHPALEPGDVVHVDAPTSGLDATPHRVLSVRLDYAARPRGRYVMRLGLGVV